MGAQERWQIEKYGGTLQRIEADYTVTTTPTPHVPPDSERVSLTLINEGTSVAWLRIGRPGAAGTGIRLPASGGGVSMTLEDDPDLIGEAMYIVVPSGTTTVSMVGSRRINSVA